MNSVTISNTTMIAYGKHIIAQNAKQETSSGGLYLPAQSQPDRLEVVSLPQDYEGQLQIGYAIIASNKKELEENLFYLLDEDIVAIQAI